MHTEGGDVPVFFVRVAMVVRLEFDPHGKGSYRWSHSRILFRADLAGAAFQAVYRQNAIRAENGAILSR